MKFDCLHEDVWMKNGKLDTDVRDSLLKIYDEILTDINEEFEELDSDFRLKPVKYIFTGSMTGPNYREDSDIDSHFVIDFSEYEDPILLNEYLKLYARNFNLKKYTIANHPVEIYFQDEKEKHYSPGIYDIKENEWIKVPDCIVIDITDEYREKAMEFLARINELREQWDSDLVKDREKFLDKVIELFREIRAYRKKGLTSEKGIYSMENIVFKLLRKNKALERLVNLIREVRVKEYEVKP